MATKSLYQKLLKIQQEVRGLTKDKTETTAKFSYVSGEKVLGFIRPKMDDLGLLLIPEVESSTFTRQDYSTSKGSKSEMFVTLEMKFTWVDVDSEETLVCRWASSGQNNWDKGLGSALTYGERYFLLKFFHIPTDIDDVDARVELDESRLAEVIVYIGGLTTKEQMQDVWQTYSPFYGTNKEFVTAFTKRQKEITDGARK